MNYDQNVVKDMLLLGMLDMLMMIELCYKVEFDEVISVQCRWVE